jgi:N-methylhydantoinase B
MRRARRRTLHPAPARKPSVRRASKPKRFDPVTAEIIRGAMETVCYEVATHVSLTATTPILNQSNERNATILDGRGRLAALSVGIPQFMLSSTLPVRFAIDFFGAGGLHDGDVLIANDPYHGGGHLPDYNVFAPVVVDGMLLLIVSIQCHHADTGANTL